MRAAATFDPAQGPHFSRHAVWGARKAILGALTSSSRLIRLPAGVVEAIGRISAARRQWELTEVNPPSVADLAQLTGLAQQRVRHVLGVMEPPFSLDGPGTPAADRTLEEMVIDALDASPEAAGLAAMQRQELLAALASLDPLAQQIVTRRYALADGAPSTLYEVATVLRLPEADVQAIEAAALHRRSLAINRHSTQLLWKGGTAVVDRTRSSYSRGQAAANASWALAGQHLPEIRDLPT